MRRRRCSTPSHCHQRFSVRLVRHRSSALSVSQSWNRSEDSGINESLPGIGRGDLGILRSPPSRFIDFQNERSSNVTRTRASLSLTSDISDRVEVLDFGVFRETDIRMNIAGRLHIEIDTHRYAP